MLRAFGDLGAAVDFRIWAFVMMDIGFSWALEYHTLILFS